MSTKLLSTVAAIALSLGAAVAPAGAAPSQGPHSVQAESQKPQVAQAYCYYRTYYFYGYDGYLYYRTYYYCY